MFSTPPQQRAVVIPDTKLSVKGIISAASANSEPFMQLFQIIQLFACTNFRLQTNCEQPQPPNTAGQMSETEGRMVLGAPHFAVASVAGSCMNAPGSGLTGAAAAPVPCPGAGGAGRWHRTHTMPRSSREMGSSSSEPLISAL